MDGKQITLTDEQWERLIVAIRDVATLKHDVQQIRCDILNIDRAIRGNGGQKGILPRLDFIEQKESSRARLTMIILAAIFPVIIVTVARGAWELIKLISAN